MQIQPFSVNDGNGIRSTIFMAGCPLRCSWCSNPEGLECRERIGWYRRKCIGCGDCVRVCPQGTGIDLNAAGERDKCISCGKCADICPEKARTRMVALTDADDVLGEIQKHRLFYQTSGGGITFSGGEATMQTELLDYLSSNIYDMGYSMDIETSGCFEFDKVAHILGRMDLIFMDLKMMDSDMHEKYTGVRNELILANMARLGELGHPAVYGQSGQSRRIEQNGPEVVVRIPVIGGINDSDENIQASAAFVHDNLPYARMELLPYHRFGAIKYEALGLRYDHPEFHTPSKERMEVLRSLVIGEGVQLADFR